MATCMHAPLMLTPEWEPLWYAGEKRLSSQFHKAAVAKCMRLPLMLAPEWEPLWHSEGKRLSKQELTGVEKIQGACRGHVAKHMHEPLMQAMEWELLDSAQDEWVVR
eukprot:1161481-Pelagomonas_calceolata.AAC.1